MASLYIPVCVYCQSKDVELRKLRCSDGTEHIAWRCMYCERWAEYPAHWIKHADLTEFLAYNNITIDDILLAGDYSSQTPCVISGKPGQIHHWAPQAWREKFGLEFNLWPTSNLCREHHIQWHRIVTPILTIWRYCEGAK